MIYESYLFDFPGRRYAFRHPDIGYASSAAALRACANAVEPTVVEAHDEQRRLFHLVAGQTPGGAYIRDPAHTVSVPHVDEVALLEWFAQLSRLDEPLTALTITDGWFSVDAHEGDLLRLREGAGSHEVEVVTHRDRSYVRGPAPRVIVAPFQIALKPDDGTLEIEVQWSAWTDSDGIGHLRFVRLMSELVAAGWVLLVRPDPADLAWRTWAKDAPQAPVIPLPVPEPPVATDRTWMRLGPARVVLGVDASERDALVLRLVIADRAASESEGTLGYREYDEPKRRAEIRAGLATSLGHAEVDVGSYEIMRRPVTNDMWRRYMASTGAQRPTAWPASGTPPKDDVVAGISRDDAAAFAAHHGWSLPSEAEWQLAATTAAIEPIADGAAEYTSDAFFPYPGADQAAFDAAAPGWQGQSATRGNAAKVPPCIESRRGLAPEHRFKFARFRCVRRLR